MVSPVKARLRNEIFLSASSLWISVSTQPSCCIRSARPFPIRQTVSPSCKGSWADAESGKRAAIPMERAAQRGNMDEKRGFWFMGKSMKRDPPAWLYK